MNGDNGTSTQAPQMRALLFTDLCDSLILVERIGDAAAAELFQQHDRLVLTLQQQWNGHQIDRSDGLFLLFDRAIDALGFALDYQRNLQRLGEQCGIPIRARAGLHVGEVILWNNSPEAVAFGAKAVEVEGLAKPMAARLMQLARPGQILVSSTAESMVRRLVDKLGETGNGLKWRSFGRWRFKGVEAPMEIFGIGGPGLESGKRPRASLKATPLLPFWRRPVAILAPSALFVTGIVVLWTMTRPEPAIAFAERDWIVLADVRNLTGQPILEDGLGQAFRISLEQSRYVNVLGDLKTRDSLSRMLLPEGSPITRDTAIQIAMRDGARAVLVPTIREVSTGVRVSVDVIDPVAAQTVYTVYADGKGISSVLSSTDQVVSKLRSRLGEAMAEVERASMPLPEVATANLDALHAYASAMKAYGQGRVPESLRLYDIAIGLDPRFGMAHMGKVRSLVAQGRRDDARAELAVVQTLSDRLSTRESLYFSAWSKEMNSGSESAALDAWRTLAELYPDHHGANVNAALALFQLGRYGEAERALSSANVGQNALRSATLQLLGRIQLARGESKTALASLRQASALADGQPNRHIAAALAASNDKRGAAQILSRLPADSPAGWLDATSLAVDEHRPLDAVAAADHAAANCGDSSSVCEFLSVVSIVVDAAAKECPAYDRARDIANGLLDRAEDPASADRGQRLYFAAAAIYAIQRLGLQAVTERQAARMQSLAKEIGDPRAAQLVALVLANQRRIRGDATGAIAELRDMVNGTELFQVHSSLAIAHESAGDDAGRAKEAAWMRGHRGLAYAEYAGSAVLQSLNVRDSLGDPSHTACHGHSGKTSN
ncbi:putative peptide modification system cyclase [Stenotrophomonas sp.]|uniref:putative peptide modification system cyclase n=1 Tax=Stenotrophomonas sp. TaxID=69392 RepID=UPI0028987CF9|nr:putative peptide modification system cyclase [Stenotrophomonas sp.]